MTGQGWAASAKVDYFPGRISTESVRECGSVLGAVSDGCGLLGVDGFELRDDRLGHFDGILLAAQVSRQDPRSSDVLDGLSHSVGLCRQSELVEHECSR